MRNAQTPPGHSPVPVRMDILVMDLTVISMNVTAIPPTTVMLMLRVPIQSDRLPAPVRLAILAMAPHVTVCCIFNNFEHF